ncbi:MAG: hypothetical protein MK074_02005 [Phycisphaerales bacterium]|nr:hypothetical protein [Phycisphaerales bacterium]
MHWLSPTIADAPPAQHDRIHVAMQAALDAGAAIMQHFESHVSGARVDTDDKADGSPVTAADTQAEAIIRAAISSAFPEDAILGEEHGAQGGTTGWRWVIDPIDGTVSFVHGVPVFGTLIGLEHDGDPIAGVMHYPGLYETVWATSAGAFWKRGNNEPVAATVSTTTALEQAMVCMTSLDYCDDDHAPWLRLHSAARRTRGWSDCHSSLLLVTGRVDAVLEPELNPWDCSAIIAVLRHAGGHFSDWNGAHTNDSSVRRGLSSNGPLHEAILNVLND